MVDRITDATTAAAGGAPGVVSFGQDMPTLNVFRLVSDGCLGAT